MSLRKCSTKNPGSKLLAMIRGPQVAQAPRTGRPGGDALEHDIEVETCLETIEQGLADADHVGGDQDLVDHLGVLAGTGRPLVYDRLTHRLEQWSQGIDDVLIAADHDRQPRFTGTDVAPRNGRIDRVDTLGPADRAISIARAGSLVVMSTSTVPGLAPASVPRSPKVTSRTSRG